MSDRDGPPLRFIHSVQTGVALMHGGADCDCAGMANPAIRRIVCSTALSPFGVYPTPEQFSRFSGGRGAQLSHNDRWRRIRAGGIGTTMRLVSISWLALAAIAGIAAQRPNTPQTTVRSKIEGSKLGPQLGERVPDFS